MADWTSAHLGSNASGSQTGSEAKTTDEIQTNGDSLCECGNKPQVVADSATQHTHDRPAVVCEAVVKAETV